MILGIDNGLGTFGWAKVDRSTALVHQLGVLIQTPDHSVASTVDRSRRTLCQVELVDSLCTDVTAIVGEAGSFNPRMFDHNVCLAMSIAALVAYAFCAGLPLYELPPKRWQHAITGTGQGTKVDYDDVYRRLEQHVAKRGESMLMLEDIPVRHRNHALDASGIASCHAIKPDLATRIR